MTFMVSSASIHPYVIYAAAINDNEVKHIFDVPVYNTG